MNSHNWFDILSAKSVRWWKNHETRPCFYPALLVAVCMAALTPLLLPGIPIGHDLYFHLTRIQALASQLAEGVFPVRIYPGIHNTGYANGLFYGDLFLYLPALLVWGGMALTMAYKLFLALIFFGSAFSMYYAVNAITGSRFAGFCGGVLYTVSSYAAGIFFIRAALGEVQCLPFLPLVLLGLYQVLFGDPRRSAPLVFGMLGLVYAHNITLVLVSLICGGVCLCFAWRLLRQPRRLMALICCGLWTLLMALAFLLPMLEMLKSDVFYLTTSPAKDMIWERTVPFLSLILEIPSSKLANWIPSGMGMIFAILLFLRLRHHFPAGKITRWSNVCLIAGTITLLGATDFLPWRGLFSALQTIQFPWRLYLPTLALFACGGALAIHLMAGSSRLKRLHWLLLVLIGAFFAYTLNVGYCYAAKIHEKNLYRNGPIPEERTSAGRQYYPDGLIWEELETLNAPEVLSGTVQLDRVERLGNRWRITFSANQGATLEVPLVYYRGYRATGAAAPAVTQTARKLVGVVLDAETPSGTLTIDYAGTEIQRYSLWLSLLSFAAYCVLLRCRRRCPAHTKREKE